MQTGQTVGDGFGSGTEPIGQQPTTTTGRLRPPGRRPLNGGWVLMVAAGLVAAVTNFALLTIDEPPSDVRVVTAAAPAGTPLSELSTSVEQVQLDNPEQYLLAGSALPDGDLVTAVPLDAGVMLRSSDLRTAVGSVAGAMSIPVPQSRAAGGLLVPGDRVDVIAPRQGGGESVSVAYVVTDVTVLGVSSPGEGLGASGTGYAVTVEVDADQALLIAAAIEGGSLDVVRTARGEGS